MGRSRDLADGTLAELNVDSNTLAVDATNDRVGIGTSSPSNKLHVSGSGNSTPAYFYTPSGQCAIRVETAGNDKAVTEYYTGGNGNWRIGPGITTAGAFEFNSVTAGATRMLIDSSGRVLAGKTSSGANNIGWEYEGSGGAMLVTRTNNPTCILNRQGGAGDTIVFRFQNSDCGNINVNTNSTAFVTSSDYRLKENVVEVTDGIDRVKLLKPSRFNFIADPNRTLDGFLAHEVSSIVPEAITGTKDAMRTEDVYDEDGNVTGTQEVPDYQGIDQSKLVPLLTAALQEAITKIESLETEMITVKSRLDALESA